MYLNQYFQRSEFACNCGCGFDTVDAELLVVITDVREHFNAPVTLNGNRCPKHNKDEGGAKNSQHLYARAADIKVKGVHPNKVQEYLLAKYPDKYGIGRYNTFTHIDTRGSKSRWDYRT
jgi:uncharacterized protein YcbK (DUF882 family)